jgi:YHS domain-containing protein
MKATFVKCDLCNAEINDKTGKCAFAIHKRTIDGTDYFFCCESHAKEFEKKKRKK